MMTLSRMKAEMAEIEERLAEIKKRHGLLEEMKVVPDKEVDSLIAKELLVDCMNVLAYVTFHDGRYGQANDYENFLDPAAKLVNKLGKYLGVDPYEGMGK